MLLCFIGLIVLLLPLSLVLTFKNKNVGFLYLLTAIIAFQLVLALVTQLFHIFTYPAIFWTTTIFGLACLAITIFKKPNWRELKPKINWWVVGGFIIIIFQLWSVHYNYTGTASTVVRETNQVSHSSYAYPYFSDEWVGVSLSKYSIDHHSLPLQNPLTPDGAHITNPLVVFFSFLSEIFLLLNLNPLTGFVPLALTTGIIIAVASYALLRTFEINPFASLLAVVGVTYITNGANLPGIWYLLPYTLGTIMLLLTLISLNRKQTVLAIAQAFLAILFYPPIIVFVAPAVLVWLFIHKKIVHVLGWVVGGGLVVFSTIFYVIGLAINNFHTDAILHAFQVGYLLRPGIESGIPSYAIWNIIPWLFLPIIIFGLYVAFTKKTWHFLTPIVIGLVFWICYAFTETVFIIEYPRVVIITSILLTISAGFAFEWFWQWCDKNRIFNDKDETKWTKIILLIIIAVLAFFYTNKSSWSALTLKLNQTRGGATVSPLAPATHYLQPDDLRLFANIHNQIFLSTYWKGLAIGAATQNYPLDSKPSVIGQTILSYQTFMSGDCATKKALAQKYYLKYAYTNSFVCDDFVSQGQSNEGFVLYLFNGK